MYKFISVIFINILILYWGSAPTIIAQEGDGGHAGAFLRIGAGVRPLSMGGAFTAVSDDITAAYWNPAGLDQLNSIQLMGMYSLLTLDRQLNYAAIAFPVGSVGTLGLNWLNLAVNNIDGRDAVGNPTGDFSDSEHAFYLSYGKSIGDILFFGGSIKLLMHSLAQNRATGYGGDVGLLFKPFKFLSLGVNLQDISSAIKWDTNSRLVETFPRTLRAGIALRPLSNSSFTMAFDIEKNEKETEKLHGGIEISPFKQFAIRAGYNNGTFSAGGSIKVPIANNSLDIAYGIFNDVVDISPIHRVSLLIEFGKKEVARPKLEENTPSEVDIFDLEDNGKITGIFAFVNVSNIKNITKGKIAEVYRTIDEEELLVGSVSVIKANAKACIVQIVDQQDGYSIEKDDIVKFSEDEEGNVIKTFVVLDGNGFSIGEELFVYRKNDNGNPIGKVKVFKVTDKGCYAYIMKIGQGFGIRRGDVIKK